MSWRPTRSSTGRCPRPRGRCGSAGKTARTGRAAAVAVFALRWTEQGGPETRPPSGRGFGTRLIEFAATQRAARPGGTDLRPGGFAGGDRVPDRLGTVSWGVPRAAWPGAGTAAAHGRLVLVVEDEFLIAMHLELLLQQHGWRVLGPAATVAEALRLLSGQTPDVALLDLNLRGELATPVAEELQARGVPFVLVSAYGAPRADGSCRGRCTSRQQAHRRATADCRPGASRATPLASQNSGSSRVRIYPPYL